MRCLLLQRGMRDPEPVGCDHEGSLLATEGLYVFLCDVASLLMLLGSKLHFGITKGEKGGQYEGKEKNTNCPWMFQM